MRTSLLKCWTQEKGMYEGCYSEKLLRWARWHCSYIPGDSSRGIKVKDQDHYLSSTDNYPSYHELTTFTRKNSWM